MQTIQGGVCAAEGFSASGVHCGIRRNKTKKDLALILSDRPASAACVYTTNLVKGAPLLVTRAHVANGQARAILCNSGNANTCNADGPEKAEAMCALLEAACGVPADDVIISSTGVIGVPMPLEPIAAGIPALVAGLGSNSADAALAILTTDLRPKEMALAFTLGGKTCHLGGIGKGSGMVHPNMATILVFITTDVAISPAMLQQALSANVQDTLNMVSVDGDTSTNDMVSVLANGAAGNPMITAPGPDFDAFCAALNTVNTYLCREIARDGEGAGKLLICHVSGAADKPAARTVAKSVICSTLVKTAMFGADANWGRVLCAIGYSGAKVDITKVGVRFCSAAGEVEVCRQGAGVVFDETLAKAVLNCDEINIRITLEDGTAEATSWGCDMTYDYVKINGAYRA